MGENGMLILILILILNSEWGMQIAECRVQYLCSILNAGRV